MLLLPVLFLVCPALLPAAPVPPAPVPASYELPGAAAPEHPRILSARSRERLDARHREGGREAETVSVLALMVEFSDLALPDSLENLSDGALVPRHEWFSERLQRVDDYYRSVSGDRLSIQYSLPDTVFTLPRAMGTYGDDELDWTLGVHWLAADAVELADSLWDFSDYELTVFIHAGPGQESDLNRDSPEQIWSGYVDFEALSEAFADSLPGYQGIPTNDDEDGYRLQRFAIAPEEEIEESLEPPYRLGSLGVMAHQMGAYLGLVSLNDYVEPQGQGAGNFDLMSSGLWNALGFVPGPPSAFNRMLMGWADVEEYGREDCAPGLDLHIEAGGALHRFPISEREYFLLENRDQDSDGDGDFSFEDDNGNGIPDHGESLLGAEWDYFTTQASAADQTPGSGLFIWRVDEELLHLSFELGTNVINAWNEHYGVCLLEADGVADLSWTPGYHTEAYGSDYDAFRAAGGPNGLIATQTALGDGTLPSTRSAEGAATGWSFSDIGPHGPSMSYRARHDAGVLAGLRWIELPPHEPVGDPLALDGGDGLRFLFAAADGAGGGLLLAAPALAEDVEFESFATLPVPPAGSPAAGDLDGDGSPELVQLGADGGVYAWRWNGQPLGGGQPLRQLDGWFTRGPLLHDVDGDGDLDIFVLENRPDSLSTRPRFLDEGGEDAGPGWAEMPGLPASRAVLLHAVDEEERGYEHPEPRPAALAFALVDSLLRVHGLPLGPQEGLWTLERPCPCLGTRLAAGDLDGDGCDELLLLRSGVAEIYHPRGRFAGTLEGRTEIEPAPLFAFGDLESLGGAVLPLDADGNGSLEMLGAYPSRAALWSADGVWLAGWPRELPANAPLVWSDDPAVWVLTARDAGGADRPYAFTRDGRLLHGEEPAALLTGATLDRSPLLASQGTALRAMGLSRFDAVESTTAGEDTLLSDPRLAFWSLELPEAGGLEPAWAMAGGDAARSGRLAAAGPVSTGAAGASFRTAYLYPNPAAERVTWRVEADGPDLVRLEIFDLEGQRLWSDRLSLDGFSPAERELALDDFAPGLYFFRIHSETSGRLATGRLAVIR